MSHNTSPRYNPETDMERIARESREFREQEAKRIAAEKEEARLEALRQKELERERIAQKSGQFLQDAAKELEAMSRLKELTAQQQREQDRLMGVDVSDKAKRLSEKERMERKRREEEDLLQQERSTRKASSRDSNVSVSDSVSLQSFSDRDDEEASDIVMVSKMSKQSTVYYDTAMSQSTLEDDNFGAKSGSNIASGSNTAPSLNKQATVYYDAAEDTPAGPASATPGKLDLTENFATPYQTRSASKADSFTVTFQDPGEESVETPFGLENLRAVATPHTVYKTPRQTPVPLESSKKTVYFDAQSRPAESITSPAGVQARTLFAAAKDGDAYLTDPSAADLAVDPNEQESIMAHKPRAAPRQTRKKKTETPDDEELLSHARVQEACYEIPIDYDASSGSFLVTRDAELSMITFMAPSRVDGRWSGTLEGKASLGPSAMVESSVGSATLDYTVNSWSKLSLGMIRGHELYHPLITMGGSLIRHGSMLGVTFYHNASFLQAVLLEHSMYSVSFRHLFQKSRWVFSSELSRRQDLSVGLSNAKVNSHLSWSLRNPKQVSARLDLRPSISEDRVAQLTAEWQSFGSWHIGASLVQSLHSKVATIGLGVRLFSTRGLEWILSWNRGGATVRIPIVVAHGVRNVHMGQILYFSMLSFLIQEGISELWGWKHPAARQSDEEPTSSTSAAVSTDKAKQDAELQKSLMARQAKRKKREEAEKEGLVIYSATYSVEGGEEWDATIPLQFWVNRSSLTLPPKSKSKLLGFYDISTTKSKARSSPKTTTTSSDILSSQWWKSVWDDLLDLPVSTLSEGSKQSGPKPTLQIRYDFQGQPYRITIRDDEELVLPNPNATRL